MEELKIKGICKHFKGDYYLVEDIAIHSETSEKYVVYRALYGEGRLYIRPYNMFMEEVDTNKYPDIKQKYRCNDNIVKGCDISKINNKINRISDKCKQNKEGNE